MLIFTAGQFRGPSESHKRGLRFIDFYFPVDKPL